MAKHRYVDVFVIKNVVGYSTTDPISSDCDVFTTRVRFDAPYEYQEHVSERREEVVCSRRIFPDHED